jgi:peptide chain release factor 3
LKDRIRTEYNIPVKFEETSLYTARWITSADALKLKTFIDSHRSAVANDHDGDPVFMARNAWHLNDAQDKNPDIKFTATKS